MNDRSTQLLTPRALLSWLADSPSLVHQDGPFAGCICPIGAFLEHVIGPGALIDPGPDGAAPCYTGAAFSVPLPEWLLLWAALSSAFIRLSGNVSHPALIVAVGVALREVSDDVDIPEA